MNPGTVETGAAALQEPNVPLLQQVLAVLGPAHTTARLAEALKGEAYEGMLVRKGTRRREGTLLCTGDPTMAKKFTLEVTEKQLDLLIGVLREAGGINQTPAFLRRVNVLLDELGRLRMRTSAAPRHTVKART